ncbi:J domain-containing protein [Rhodothermus marinus]|uniref:J domain-containing protein n=1 Tax=Rhodothermus marinus TaxID=29549 RepID=UPI0012BA3A82|nr:J domain-containing protein [Rhodothermus marinus]BBM69627.1 hypothetical protein RmaAA213_14730 [Rhodothermus marinus]BBM72609.1 hypothetical protein RmaAA338_14740 [Rhodothermus marinus]
MDQFERVSTLIERGNYEAAFLLLGDSVDLALRELEADRRARRNGTILGIGLSLLTGGLGLEDLIIGPLAYKAARFFGGGTMKPEEAGALLWEALNLRLLMIKHFAEIVITAENPARILRDLLVVYFIAKESFERFDELLPVLIAPTQEKNLHRIVSQLEAEVGDERTHDFDTILFICLLLYGLQHWNLYQKLRTGREALEQEIEEILREERYGASEAGADLDRALERHYAAVLELEAPYTPEKVRRNYRRLIKTCHPDRMQQASAAERRQAEERARELNEAYEYFRARLNF